MPRLAIRTVVLLALLSAACDDGTSPTAPSQTQIPHVAGTYAGPLVVTTDGRTVLRASAQVRVQQSGSRLTITGSVSLQGQIVSLPRITGTVMANGRITNTSGGVAEAVDPTCGHITTTSSSANFSGDILHYTETASTTFCGTWHISGTLRRGASNTPTTPVRPVDARFRDRFWQELVFDQYDDPGRMTTRRSWVLENPSPNVYIRMGDPTGRRVVSYKLRDHMQKAIPRLATQLTGRSYRGRIESGIGDRKRPGWITVRFVTQEEEPERTEGACARASVGADPGNIWIIRRARGNKNCVGASFFPVLFAHEFGHAMGFFHVADRTAIMASRSYTGRETFNAREQYHARIAYEVGRGEQYCGWPFQASCTRYRSSLRSESSLRGLAPIVID